MAHLYSFILFNLGEGRRKIRLMCVAFLFCSESGTSLVLWSSLETAAGWSELSKPGHPCFFLCFCFSLLSCVFIWQGSGWTGNCGGMPRLNSPNTSFWPLFVMIGLVHYVFHYCTFQEGFHEVRKLISFFYGWQGMNRSIFPNDWKEVSSVWWLPFNCTHFLRLVAPLAVLTPSSQPCIVLVEEDQVNIIHQAKIWALIYPWQNKTVAKVYKPYTFLFTLSKPPAKVPSIFRCDSDMNQFCFVIFNHFCL